MSVPYRYPGNYPDNKPARGGDCGGDPDPTPDPTPTPDPSPPSCPCAECPHCTECQELKEYEDCAQCRGNCCTPDAYGAVLSFTDCSCIQCNFEFGTRYAEATDTIETVIRLPRKDGSCIWEDLNVGAVTVKLYPGGDGDCNGTAFATYGPCPVEARLTKTAVNTYVFKLNLLPSYPCGFVWDVFTGTGSADEEGSGYCRDDVGIIHTGGVCVVNCVLPGFNLTSSASVTLQPCP